ncbi:MAG: hypothetical protein AB9861_04500 [Methanosarcina sp.]
MISLNILNKAGFLSEFLESLFFRIVWIFRVLDFLIKSQEKFQICNSYPILITGSICV